MRVYVWRGDARGVHVGEVRFIICKFWFVDPASPHLDKSRQVSECDCTEVSEHIPRFDFLSLRYDKDS